MAPIHCGTAARVSTASGSLAGTSGSHREQLSIGSAATKLVRAPARGEAAWSSARPGRPSSVAAIAMGSGSTSTTMAESDMAPELGTPRSVSPATRARPDYNCGVRHPELFALALISCSSDALPPADVIFLAGHENDVWTASPPAARV